MPARIFAVLGAFITAFFGTPHMPWFAAPHLLLAVSFAIKTGITATGRGLIAGVGTLGARPLSENGKGQKGKSHGEYKSNVELLHDSLLTRLPVVVLTHMHQPITAT
jgi:hypothetical protein